MAEPSRGEEQGLRRLAIHPLDVVHDDEGRPVDRRRGEQAQRRRTDEKPVAAVACPPTQCGVEGGGLRRRYGLRIPAQRLGDREQPGKRQNRLRFDATYGQTAPARAGRDRGERVEQRRLPDARLALNHGRCGRTRSSAIQQAAQRGHLRVPPEQRAGTARTDGSIRRPHSHTSQL